MKKITTIGRILFAIPFALFGINHFLMTDYYIGMLTSFIPLGLYNNSYRNNAYCGQYKYSIQKELVISTIMLAALLSIFIVTIHIPHLIAGKNHDNTIALLKDISLMGGSLMIAGIYSRERGKIKFQPDIIIMIHKIFNHNYNIYD